MTLQIETFVLGPIENNTYLLWDRETREAAVIDPSFEPGVIVETIQREKLKLTGIWLTHAHFDHYFGIPTFIASLNQDIPIFFHHDDEAMYHSGGLGAQFGVELEKLPKSAQYLVEGQVLCLGQSCLEVLFTPGHSAGHVSFYSEEAATVFTGDLIFKQSVGRTDLPGADADVLLKSIYTQILTLPGDTRILPGHGESTTVEDEVEFNPYLN